MQAGFLAGLHPFRRWESLVIRLREADVMAIDGREVGPFVVPRLVPPIATARTIHAAGAPIEVDSDIQSALSKWPPELF